MADHLPILVFPKAKKITPPKGRGFGPKQPHCPTHEKQSLRITKQLQLLKQKFSKFKASVSNTMSNIEPESVIVIEIIGSVNDFKNAVDSTEGLDWMGEWEIDDIDPTDDFYEEPSIIKIGVNFFKNKITDIVDKEGSIRIRNLLLENKFINSKGELTGEDLILPNHLHSLKDEIIQFIESEKNTRLIKSKKKKISGRLFFSMSNQQGLNELLTLWSKWEKEQELPQGKAKWRDVFTQLSKIRQWGIEDSLSETGMIERWENLTQPVSTVNTDVVFQIELFYRNNAEMRKNNELVISQLLDDAGGRTLGTFIDLEEISFHAVKAQLPASKINELLEEIQKNNDISIQLFKFPGIMFVRPTGQNIASAHYDSNMFQTSRDFNKQIPEEDPVIALLDGVPNLQHIALKNRILFDDPDNLSSEYQAGERRHGTSMVSLIIHGELSDSKSLPLTSLVYHLPIMQIDSYERSGGNYYEGFPDEVFFEDRIERAVRRIFEGEGDTPAQAPTVKIINISLGDSERPFIHMPSPWARLLDWLSYKYNVLFCVSAGNHLDDIELKVSNTDFNSYPNDERINHIIKCIDSKLSKRRLFSPAESINSLTIGAIHNDSSGDYNAGGRIDLTPCDTLFSPINCFGHGFRRSIKPELYFPGGRQLYYNNGTNNIIANSYQKPGQQVAWDSSQQGDLSKTVFTRGTSNATALASRSGARIYEVLSSMTYDSEGSIRDEFMAVLIKTLLVHGSKHNKKSKQYLEKSLKTTHNSRKFKEFSSRYLGYGTVDIERVLVCTEQRATVIGSGEIKQNEVHEYLFPLPISLSKERVWRRMVVTLAWFSPINPIHRNLREAKLSFQAPNKSNLNIDRVDGDHNQVKRGTIQHEVLEGNKEILEFLDGEFISIHVTCKADATENLDETIPYGIAVTLETEEEIGLPIYLQIRDRIKTKVKV